MGMPRASKQAAIEVEVIDIAGLPIALHNHDAANSQLRAHPLFKQE